MILSPHAYPIRGQLDIYSPSEYLLTTYWMPDPPSPPQKRAGNSEIWKREGLVGSKNTLATSGSWDSVLMGHTVPCRDNQNAGSSTGTSLGDSGSPRSFLTCLGGAGRAF